MPVKARADLVVREMLFQGVPYYVAKDPVALTYHRLQHDQYAVLGLLDGQRSLEQIQEALTLRLLTTAPPLGEIQQLIFDLHEKGLAYGTRFGQAVPRITQRHQQFWKKVRSGFANILSLRLPGWDPERFLSAILPFTRWLFQPLTAMAAALFVVSAWILLAINFEEFRRGVPVFQQFFGWRNLTSLWMTAGAAKILHEFGHGLSCKYFGGECHNMGIMLLFGSPCLYCDVSDSWMLRNKWHRMLIGAAGMIVEVVLSAGAIFVWALSEPGTLHFLALNIFFVTAISTVIFNANPLMRLDGYFILSDFVEVPNLRTKADRLLQNFIARVGLGVEPRHDPLLPQTRTGWYVLFASASAVYGWSILAGVGGSLYYLLKPYGLQSVPAALIIYSIGGTLFRWGSHVRQAIKSAPPESIKRSRIVASGLIVVGILVLLTCIPIPWIRSAPFVIEPHDAQEVTTQVPGQLVDIFVQPGDQVVMGQPLALLFNPKLDDQIQKKQTERDVLHGQIHLANSLDHPAERIVAEENLRSVESELQELEQRQRHLKILAPRAGKVVAAQRVAEPSLDQAEARLGGWTGTPLDEQNRGARLETRTTLLSIAPDERFQAVLYLEQADRLDVHEGLDVGLKFNHLPGRVFRGSISKIAPAHAEFVPKGMSIKHGGALHTVTDRDGREQLSDPVYQATVVLDATPELLRTDLRGNSRFIVARRSVLGWLWRFIRINFHFRL